MKKYLILLFISGMTISSFAQENWLFSPSLGFNLTAIDEGGVTGQNQKAGVSFGFSALQIVEEKWSFNYGISFNKRYATYSFTNESAELEDLLGAGGIPLPGGVFDLTVYESTNVFSSYWTFDVPITVSLKLGSGFIFYGGGYVNFLISTKNEEELTKHIPVFETLDFSTLPIPPEIFDVLPENETTTSSNESSANMQSFSYGALFGFGYQSDKWLLKIGYQYGLSNIRTDLDDINMNIKKQRAYTISIGYLISGLFQTSKNKAKYDLDFIE